MIKTSKEIHSQNNKKEFEYMGTEEEQARSLNDYLASSYETLKILKKRRRKRIFIIILVGILLIFIFFIVHLVIYLLLKSPCVFMK